MPVYQSTRCHIGEENNPNINPLLLESLSSDVEIKALYSENLIETHLHTVNAECSWSVQVVPMVTTMLWKVKKTVSACRTDPHLDQTWSSTRMTPVDLNFTKFWICQRWIWFRTWYILHGKPALYDQKTRFAESVYFRSVFVYNIFCISIFGIPALSRTRRVKVKLSIWLTKQHAVEMCEQR
jgi:hypothetical protein